MIMTRHSERIVPSAAPATPKCIMHMKRRSRTMLQSDDIVIANKGIWLFPRLLRVAAKN